MVSGEKETPETSLRKAGKRKLAATVQVQKALGALTVELGALKEARAAELEAAVAVDPDDPQVLRIDEPAWKISPDLLTDLEHGPEQPRADALAERARRERERLRAREQRIATAVQKRLGGLPSVMKRLSGDELEEAEQRYWKIYNEWVARNGDPAERRRAEERGDPPDWVRRFG
jgi:hypothetical protein